MIWRIGLHAWEYLVQHIPDYPSFLQVYPRNLQYKAWLDPKFEIVDLHAHLLKSDLIPAKLHHNNYLYINKYLIFY